MVAFYTYLEEGLPKDEALQRAKLDLISQANSPYFWAGPIISGNMEPIQFRTVWYRDLRWISAIIIVLILLFLGWQVYRRQQRA